MKQMEKTTPATTSRKRKKKDTEKEEKEETAKKSTRLPATANEEQLQQPDDNDDLEDFEIGASEHVTKQDAMKLYCLPQGTLAVCKWIEKPNPRHASWKPMKLYERAEIRRRARERFGGRAGLAEERRKREAKRLEKDMEKAKDFFL